MSDHRTCPTCKDRLYNPHGSDTHLCLNGCGYREVGPPVERDTTAYEKYTYDEGWL